MKAWQDEKYPSILRMHISDKTLDGDNEVIVDDVIMRIATSTIGVNLLVTKEQDELTTARLDRILSIIKTCVIQKNLQKFSIIHPEVITLPYVEEKEILDKWAFFRSLDEAYDYVSKSIHV